MAMMLYSRPEAVTILARKYTTSRKALLRCARVYVDCSTVMGSTNRVRPIRHLVLLCTNLFRSPGYHVIAGV